MIADVSLLTLAALCNLRLLVSCLSPGFACALSDDLGSSLPVSLLCSFDCSVSTDLGPSPHCLPSSRWLTRQLDLGRRYSDSLIFKRPIVVLALRDKAEMEKVRI